MPVSILIVVDLPAPFGPMKATDCPAGIERLTPSTATISMRSRRSPRRFVWTNVFRSSSSSMRPSISGG
jgi:hypothetical protein